MRFVAPAATFNNAGPTAMNPNLNAANPIARKTTLTAIMLITGLLLGCAAADKPGTEASYPTLPAGLALFHTLVSKPAARPLSSLHRLAAFVTNTTFDTLDPDSIFLTGRGSVPPSLQMRGMDLAAWEEQLDELTGRAPSKGTIRFLVDGGGGLSPTH